MQQTVKVRWLVPLRTVSGTGGALGVLHLEWMEVERYFWGEGRVHKVQCR